MNKDFQKWHDKKAQVDKLEKRPFFHEREIWFCSVGSNVGVEMDGRGTDFMRPVVIVHKFNSQSFWAIPLTRTIKDSNLYYVFSFIPDVQSAANLSQLRLVDAKRLGRLAGKMSETDFQELVKRLKALLP